MTDTDKLVLRPARREDVPSIVRLLADDHLGATREALTDPLPASYYAAFDAISAQSGSELLVGQIGSEVVACLQLMILPGLSHQGMTRAQLEGVRVDAPLRGKGIGEKLCLYAIERAKEKGCGLVQLTSDNSRVAAHRFYERMDFKKSHVGMKLSFH